MRTPICLANDTPRVIDFHRVSCIAHINYSIRLHVCVNDSGETTYVIDDEKQNFNNGCSIYSRNYFQNFVQFDLSIYIFIIEINPSEMFYKYESYISYVLNKIN